MSVITGTQIIHFRHKTLLRGMKLEATGLKMSRGVSCLAIVKKEFGFKGSREKVIAQLEAYISEVENGYEGS